MGSIRFAKFDVVLNAIVKQVHCLEHHAEITHQTIQSVILHVNSTQFDRAAVHIPKTGHEAGEGSLSGARWSYNSRSGAFWNGKAHILNDFALSIGKVHMVEGDVPALGSSDRTTLVHPGRLVNRIHLADGCVDHRQHEKHLACG